MKKNLPRRNNISVSVFFLGFLALSGRCFAADTTIKGGKMELLNKGQEVLFTKGVRLERGKDIIEAQQMKTDKSRKKIFASGKVKLFRKNSSTESWKGQGDTGFYNTESGEGYLVGNSKPAFVTRTEIVSSTQSRTVDLWAHQIDFFEQHQQAEANGNVTGQFVDPETMDKYEFLSDRAKFDGKTNELILSGETLPSVTQNSLSSRRRIVGETITYNSQSRKMVSEGQSQVVMEERESLEEKKP